MSGNGGRQPNYYYPPSDRSSQSSQYSQDPNYAAYYGQGQTTYPSSSVYSQSDRPSGSSRASESGQGSVHGQNERPGDTTRYWNAAAGGAPLIGQGITQAGVAASTSRQAPGETARWTQGYGGAVGATASVGAGELARQGYYAVQTRRYPDVTQPAFTPGRAAFASGMVIGGAVYGAGAGQGNAAMQAGGAMAQGVGEVGLHLTEQRYHYPNAQRESRESTPGSDDGRTLPLHNQDVATAPAAQYIQMLPGGGNPYAASSSGNSTSSQPPAWDRQSNNRRRRGPGGGGGGGGR
jgi:hypothetical protein